MKDRWTVSLCCNCTGDIKVPLAAIGKSKKPRTFPKNVQDLGLMSWSANKSAWMTTEIFNQWLQDFSKLMRTHFKDESVCLIIDNAPSHRVIQPPANVEVYYLPPNVTASIQLLDAGVIHSFKCHYRRGLTALASSFIDLGKSWSDFIRQFSARQAIELMVESWDSVTTATIYNCAVKIGLISNESNNEVVEVRHSDNSELIDIRGLFVEEQQLILHEPFDINFIMSAQDEDNDLESATVSPVQ